MEQYGMAGSAHQDPKNFDGPWLMGAVRERSIAMKKKGKKDEVKGPKKGK
jgi:hypothetical protein